MRGQILILDDNILDIKIVSSVLERSGYACFGSISPEEALRWLETNRPSMIFLDLIMPRTTGYELIPVLRKMSTVDNVPIIIISGKNQIEDVKKAISLGANDYIVKPIDPLVLQEKAQKIEKTSDQEFQTISVESEGLSGHFAKPFNILAVSEFGLQLVSETRVLAGETLAVDGLRADFFGSPKILMRCLSSTSLPEGGFMMQMTFVGMTEGQRQIIRKSCRNVWVTTKVPKEAL